MSSVSRRSDTVICLDLGGTNIRAGVVNQSGQILCRARALTPAGAATPADPADWEDGQYEAVLAAVGEVIDELEGGYPPGRRRTHRGISIGVPGIVDPVTGDVVGGFNVFGNGRPRVSFKRDLEARRRTEVRIDRDVNLAALGEHRFGAGRGYTELVCIFIGTGIGAGLIVNGTLYRGAVGAAGELGHLTVDRDGEPCGCGNRGCLERESSGQAIARKLRRRRSASTAAGGGPAGTTAGAVTAREVFELAGEGDPLAAEVIEQAGVSLGIAIASVVTLLNPQRVILGGGVARQFDLLIGPISAEIRRRCRPVVSEAVDVVPSQLWDDAAILGGAGCFFGY